MAHEVKIVPVEGGMGTSYQAQCNCGWKGTPHFAVIARAQAEDHLSQR